MSDNSALTADTIYAMDAVEGLKKLPDESIDCVVTSPPYWATRDYGVPKMSWPDGTEAPLGLEDRFEVYIEHLCMIFDAVWRVLKPTGTCWINLGDTYHNASRWTRKDEAPQTISGGNNRNFNTGRRMNQGLPEKCLVQIPGRFAIEMTKRGWSLRNDIVWYKPNHMPSSVKDRFACGWEHLYLFVKQRKYFFDLDAVRVPHKTVVSNRARPSRAQPRNNHHPLAGRVCPQHNEPQAFHPLGKNPGDFWQMPSETRTLGAILGQHGVAKVPGGAGWTGHARGGSARIVRENDPRWLSPGGKNPGDVWQIPTRNAITGHFAMFPEKLIQRPILAGCPARICKRCGTPRLTRSRLEHHARKGKENRARSTSVTQRRSHAAWGCKCRQGSMAGLVLDPFMGAGTTAVVAKRMGRRFIGFDVNSEYVKMAQRRVNTMSGEHTAETRV